MITYLALKHLHITCVVITITFFILRFYWSMSNPEKLQVKWVRILPHCIDTVLLASAVSMAWMAQLNPIENFWLFGKIVALIAYIVLGYIALKSLGSRRGRLLAFFSALFWFGVIVHLAINKHF